MNRYTIPFSKRTGMRYRRDWSAVKVTAVIALAYIIAGSMDFYSAGLV